MMIANDRYIIVKDEKILKDFLKEIGVDEMSVLESCFICTSFRSKKLPEDQKGKFARKMREIFLTKYLKKNSKGVFEYEEAINRIYELEIPKRACTYNIGTPDEFCLPQSSLVCFISPNPSKEVDVAIEHMENTLDLIKEYIHAPNKENSAYKLAHTNTDFRGERARIINKKYFDIDIDVDYKKEDLNEVKSIIKDTLQKSKSLKDLKGILIQTSGGFHTLIKCCCLCGDPKKIIQELLTNLKSKCTFKGVNPIEYKRGGFFCPLPGTLQYGSHLLTYEII